MVLWLLNVVQQRREDIHVIPLTRVSHALRCGGDAGDMMRLNLEEENGIFDHPWIAGF